VRLVNTVIARVLVVVVVRSTGQSTKHASLGTTVRLVNAVITSVVMTVRLVDASIPSVLVRVVAGQTREPSRAVRLVSAVIASVVVAVLAERVLGAAAWAGAGNVSLVGRSVVSTGRLEWLCLG
jgi:hypothetical protein